MLQSQGLRAANTRGGGNAASVSYRAIYSSTTDASTYTFTSSDIGTATDRSAIVVAVHTAGNAPSSVTVGGTSATQINTVGSTVITSLWRVSGVSGTTATIVVNTSGTATRCLIGVYALYNLRSTTPIDNATTFALSGSSRTLTLNTIVNGVIIGCASTSASPRSFNWTGATENYDTSIESANVNSGASAVTTSNTTTTVSFTTLSTGLVYALASWR